MAKEEQIRKAIDNLDEATAKDALALLLADTSSGTKTQTANNPINQEAGQFANFAQAILWLKSKYKFQELNAFTTEADLVYVNTGDRRILLTDTTVGPRKNPEPQMENSNSFNIETNSNSNINESSNENSSSEDMDNAFEPLKKNDRFNNLEL